MASNSRITLDHLVRLAPTPALPIDPGTPEDWERIEQTLGTPLPPDYKQIINAYGTGGFNDLFFLFNPFSHVSGMNLLKQVQEREVSRGLDTNLYRYKQVKKDSPKDCPFPPFPTPGGLMPLGGDTNGGYAFWLMDGVPAEWTLVLYPHGWHPIEQHPIPLVEFLVSWLSGKLPNCFFGAGGHYVHATEPIFQNS